MNSNISVVALKKQYLAEMSIASQNMRDIQKALTTSEIVFLITHKVKKRG